MRKYLVSLLIGTTVYLLVISIVLLLYVCRHVPSPRFSSSKKQVFREYKMTELNLFDDTISLSSSGFVTLPLSLEANEEHVSYFNENTGSSTIITNFGGKNHRCVGSCFCRDDSFDDYRRSSRVLTHGLVIVFTAFSSTMAYRVARETFLEQCQHEFSLDGANDGICKRDNIQSEVEECEEEELGDIKGLNTNRFLCKGYCVSLKNYDMGNPAQVTDEIVDIGHREIGLCESLNLELEITLMNSDEGLYQEHNPENSYTPMHQSMAKLKFAEGPLSSFCLEESRIPHHLLPKREQEMTELAVESLEKMVEEQRAKGEIDGETKHMYTQGKSFVEKGRPFCYGMIMVDDWELKQKTFDEIKAFVPTPSSLENVECVKVR